jgi:uncharacterized protein YdaU (DUF1376 family)
MSQDKQKPPAYQWYPKDYESDEAVRLMTYEQEGIYRRLLDHQALHGSIPSDTSQIALLVPKVPRARFLKLWPMIATKFPVGADSRLVNRRLERSQREYAEYLAAQSDNGKKGAEKRWHRDSTANGTAIATPIAKVTPSTATATSTAKEHERARDGGSSLERVTDAFRAHWKRVYGHESTLTLNHLQVMQLEQQVDKCGEAEISRRDGGLSSRPTMRMCADRSTRSALLLRDPARFLAAESPVRSAGVLTPEETREAQRRLREQAS